ncbi:hypothetical protein INS49_014970 [Diaporthe citri]|uniref:uncharacterized protein n=1 Tax=Diaporthe citri TaxID=83186 RepID=UPI001C8083CD|nr:uncharacterized protein INS49_014970 [Diaporthe citri]KAG6357093.1 hypothetical protein INS49_014970 [Diaporthe citri]
MTAIRPQPPPGQQRREEALAQAEANRILLSQSRLPLILAVFYVALLVVPWVLTCKIADQPSFIVHIYERGYEYYVQHGWVIAINVLNSLAAVLSLPILSALLARAAVVFSQRRKPGQTLSVRQLFALADRDWYNFFKVLSPVGSSALLRLGFLVLFIALSLPLVRPGLVAYDNVLVMSNFPEHHEKALDYGALGYTPSPLAAKTASEQDQDKVITETRKSLRTTVGGIEPNLWPVCNDKTTSDGTCGFTYGPYDLGQSRLGNFWEWPNQAAYERNYSTNGSALMHASTLRAGSSIGSYYKNEFGAYTLGLKSGTRCEPISAQEVEEQCLRSTDTGALPTAARGWNTNLAIEGEVVVDICYPPLERSPWETADAFPWKPINFTEHLYIGLSDNGSTWDCPSWSEDCGYAGTDDGLYLHCQADFMMSFFEIGSARTKGVPTRFLDEMPSGFDIPRGKDLSSRSDISSRDSPTSDYIGPLKTATMAMFGNDSWLDTFNLVTADLEPRQRNNEWWTLPVRVQGPHTGTTLEDWYTPSRLFSWLARDFFRSFSTRKLARATLNTATFYANNALLTRMKDRGDWRAQDYKRTTEESDELMVVPVLSTAAIVTVSILIALQVVCIVILLVYIYSRRVWTLTLDALAMARVGAQLSALDVFLVPRETGTLGTARLNPRAVKQLDQVDGLVGATALTGHHDIELATMPPPYAPRGEEPSTREERRVHQPGAASAARDAAAHDHPVPSYSPPADEHTVRAAGGEAGIAGGRDDAHEMAISHAASSESRGAVLPAVISLEAIAVGGRGLITRRMWRAADKPLPARPAEQ